MGVQVRSDSAFGVRVATAKKDFLVQRVRDHKAGKSKERPLPKKESVEDQREESEDEDSVRGGVGFIG